MHNKITAPFASVSGGFLNTASSEAASVSGGKDNFASGDFASVSGGNDNTAGGRWPRSAAAKPTVSARRAAPGSAAGSKTKSSNREGKKVSTQPSSEAKKTKPRKTTTLFRKRR